MMREGVGLIDVPKAGRRVIDYYHLPSEQTAWAAPYRGREGKLCSRKNTNRHNGIFRRSKPDCPRMEVLGSQFLAHLSRTGLYVIAHAGRSSCSSQRNPDQPKNCVTRLSVPASSVSVENKVVPAGSGSLERYSRAIDAQQYIPALRDTRTHDLGCWRTRQR
jgi:hypothetical protein